MSSANPNDASSIEPGFQRLLLIIIPIIHLLFRRKRLIITVTIANTSAGTATNASLSDLLPAGANVNWSISPAYTGPGTCSIGGAVGTQTLTCSFGNIAANAAPFSVSPAKMPLARE